MQNKRNIRKSDDVRSVEKRRGPEGCIWVKKGQMSWQGLRGNDQRE